MPRAISIASPKNDSVFIPLYVLQSMIKATSYRMQSVQTYWTGMLNGMNRFLNASWYVVNAYAKSEGQKGMNGSSLKNINDYNELMLFEVLMARRGLAADFSSLNKFCLEELRDSISLWPTGFDLQFMEKIAEEAAKQARLMDVAVNGYDRSADKIRSAYGFHFQGRGYVKSGETDRFVLYQVLPTEKAVPVRNDIKPVLIIPPYVLGPNILAFLPGEKKSYVHAFANQGIPTYIRILKDIDTTEAVQTMIGDDDARDTRLFCEFLKLRHEKPVTLNGFCQGGFVALLDLLSGELDGLVDALITCVAPIDGTKSHSLGEFLEKIPSSFRDIRYAVKTLSNGNQVVDGEIMSFVYKLKSIERESPLNSLHRDIRMFHDQGTQKKIHIDKTMAAINYWMTHDRQDIPLAITKMSYDSYSIPVAGDGTLPVRLFGRRLNLGRLRTNGIPWLICIAERDDLVDREVSLAPLKYLDAELAVFPKGHVSIATSWSVPESSCALDKNFDSYGDGRVYRGPVRFHLDLNQGPRGGQKGKNGNSNNRRAAS